MYLFFLVDIKAPNLYYMLWEGTRDCWILHYLVFVCCSYPTE